MIRARVAWGGAVVAAIACGPTEVEDTSVGEVLVVVDTDMPVPAFVARLHVDLYDASGVWYATRDVERGRPSDWPASFGLNVTEAEGERVVTVRLRAYPERATRDYRGERHQARVEPVPGLAALLPVPPPPATGEPRLRDERGVDVSPAEEPQPLLAIDRLVKVRVRPGARRATRVLLQGACVGTMADLARGLTCVDSEGVLVPTPEARLETDRAQVASLPSRAFAFDPRGDCTVAPRPGARALDGTPLFDDEVCVPGAMYRFGTPEGVFGQADAAPERIVVLEPFLLDRFEVTVARYRDAVRRGFV